MNYNTYPANATSPEIMGEAAREKEYRQELAESIVAESIGTVGIYTSLDLEDKDKVHLKQVIAERNPEGSDNVIKAGGGWGDWGERHLVRTTEERSLQNTPNDILLQPHAKKHEDREEVRFVEMPDDTVELRYRYAAAGYKDGTGRPGNVLDVGFTLSHDKASELRSALEADPTYIDDILKAQVLAIGMSEENWYRYICPRDGFKAIKEDKLAIIHASVEGDVRTERFAYADKKAMLPAYEQPAPTEELELSPDDSVELNDAWEESYEDTLRMVGVSIMYSREQGKTDSVIRDELAELLVIAKREMHESEANEQNDPEDAARSRAMYSAYGVAVNEFDSQQAEAVQQAELTNAQLSQVEAAQSEVADAFASETSTTFKPGDRVTVGGESMTVMDSYAMQNEAQTLMIVVQDSLGGQTHLKAASIK